MPNRWNPETRAVYYAHLCTRDGEFCRACGRKPYQLDDTLEIDELNCKKTDHRKENLQLLCKSCNVARNNHYLAVKEKWAPGGKWAPGARKEVPGDAWGSLPECGHDPSPPLFNTLTGEVSPSDCVYMCEAKSRHHRAVKNAAEYWHGSTETKANALMEPVARGWILLQVTRHGSISVKDAIDGAAELSGASTSTVERNYLAKLIGPTGPLEKVTDSTHRAIVVLRGKIPFPNGTVEQAALFDEQQGRVNGASPTPVNGTSQGAPIPGQEKEMPTDYDEQREAAAQAHAEREPKPKPAWCRVPGCRRHVAEEGGMFCERDRAQYRSYNHLSKARGEGLKVPQDYLAYRMGR